MKLDYPSYVEVDLDRLHHNIGLIHRTVKVPLLVVVKANAYGHGAVAVAKQLERRKEVAGLCVWTVEEAAPLRRAGVKGRIVVLGGLFPGQEKNAVEMNLEAVISSLGEARALARRAGRRPARAHLKINTGMARLGAGPSEAFDLFRGVAKLQKLSLAGVMTHLAGANRRDGRTKDQLAVFDDIIASVRSAGMTVPPRHAANTAASFLHPAAHYDLARPGIGVYGAQEFGGRDVGLLPVMSWRARVMLARSLKKGEPVSYEGAWVSPGKRTVAVVCVGYADGYSRSLSNRARAIIGGKKIRQVGNICMDSCLFDVTGLNVKVGDVVTVVGADGGETIRIQSLARQLNTISYEIMCGVTRRPKRVYVRSGRVDRGLTGAHW